MQQTLLIVGLLASLIATVAAINCYSCESVYEPNCGEDFEIENHFKMDCSRTSPPRFLENELEIDRNSTACMKRIYKESGEQKIVRSCFFGDVNDTAVGCRLDPTLEQVEEVSCHVCDNENFCNQATLPQTWPTNLAIGGALVLLAQWLQQFRT